MFKPPMEWSAILVDVVSKPGVISEASRRFWNYSVGNQFLALMQCAGRNLEPDPINTFIGWKALGQSVKKGEKALTLCMPLRSKHPKATLADEAKGHEGSGPQQEAEVQIQMRTIFSYPSQGLVCGR